MTTVQLSVSQCVSLINQTLDYAYPDLSVTGEVSEFKVSQGKYVFFNIKDDQASLSCFMMKWQLRTPLEDGMKIEVFAQPKVTDWGKFSLTVKQINLLGEGSLRRAFELLKAKLEKEGLFEPSRKRLLPELPSRIGVITSTEAAGFADFKKILNQRFGGLKIEVAHVLVQGNNAPVQIMRALQYFNESEIPPEVIVIVRGGGSLDDLAAFNDEPLVRAVAASRVPTLVGVGHETDVTLADMAADQRASTPSNAAQIIVPDKLELIHHAKRSVGWMLDQVQRQAEEKQQQVKQARLASYDGLLRRHQQIVTDYQALRRSLGQVNPRQVLKRGYAIVRSGSKVLGSNEIDKLEKGDELAIELNKAIIKTGVINVKRK